MDKKEALHLFAEYLQEKREAVLCQFVAGVRIQPTITTTDDWEKPKIQDELSRLLDDLYEELQNPGAPGPLEDALQSALAHGSQRWEQHYHQSELLGEFAVFREILMVHLSWFEESQPEIDVPARLAIEVTVHRFLDQLMIQGASRFAKRVDEDRGQGRP
ncbi:MAG: hypothetical protein V4710_24670 [Verrucomicrobiota bacterium]